MPETRNIRPITIIIVITIRAIPQPGTPDCVSEEKGMTDTEYGVVNLN